MPDHDRIYRLEADMYERLIAREDYEENIGRILSEFMPPDRRALDVLDMGAGTGRLSRLLAPLTGSITLTDASPAMLEVAAGKLRALGCDDAATVVSDHRELPFPDRAFDAVTAGWTVCYLANTNEPKWRLNLQSIVDEWKRVIRPGGTVILFENNGTGVESPEPPTYLTGYYRALQEEYGFSYWTIRTDYRFESPEEAEQLTRFFFGDALADRVRAGRNRIVPECTAVFWKRF